MHISAHRLSCSHITVSLMLQDLVVFWDFENCPIPSQRSGFDVVSKLRDAFLAHGTIKQFKAYLSLSEQASSSRMTSLRSELQLSGVTLVDVPHSGRKNAVDLMMIVDMMACAMDRQHPTTIILLTADRDFAYLIATLRFRGFNVMLVSPLGNTTHSSLRVPVTHFLNWHDVIGSLPSSPRSTPPETTEESYILPQSVPKESNILTGKPNQVISGRHSQNASLSTTSLGSTSTHLSWDVTADRSATPKDSPTLSREPEPVLDTPQSVSIFNPNLAPFVPSNATSNSPFGSPAVDKSIGYATDKNHSPPVLSTASAAPLSNLKGLNTVPGRSPSSLSFGSIDQSSGVISRIFKPLVDVLQDYRAKGQPKAPPHSVVAQLERICPNVYQAAQVEGWSAYTSKAEVAKIIARGGSGSGAWIGLNARIPSKPAYSSCSPAFAPLIQILQLYKRQGVVQPERSKVAVLLMEVANKGVYGEAGVASFKEYTQLAVTEGLVLMGGLEGGAWIALK